MSCTNGLDDDIPSISDTANDKGRSISGTTTGTTNDNGRSILDTTNDNGRSTLDTTNDISRSILDTTNDNGRSISHTTNDNGRSISNNDNNRSVLNTTNDNGRSIPDTTDDNAGGPKRSIMNLAEPCIDAIVQDPKFKSWSERRTWQIFFDSDSTFLPWHDALQVSPALIAFQIGSAGQRCRMPHNNQRGCQYTTQCRHCKDDHSFRIPLPILVALGTRSISPAEFKAVSLGTWNRTMTVSHLCGNGNSGPASIHNCVTPSHITFEPNSTNNTRKSCHNSWRDGVRRRCPHRPHCIRYHQQDMDRALELQAAKGRSSDAHAAVGSPCPHCGVITRSWDDLRLHVEHSHILSDAHKLLMFPAAL